MSLLLLLSADSTATAPSISTSAAQSVEENTTFVVTCLASGSATITWSITGGADAALFSIDSDDGTLAFDAAPDYETPGDADADNDYLVEVTATNGVGTDALAITVSVQNVNEDAGWGAGPAASAALSAAVPVTFTPSYFHLLWMLGEDE